MAKVLNTIAKRAEEEGISALLYYGIKSTRLLDSLPPNFISELAHHYYNNASFNLLAQQRLSEILDVFEPAGIDAILLKGLALIESAYPNIAIRPISDIDLLIKEDDYPLVKNKLYELGYACTEHYPEDFYNGEMTVDVHTSILNSVRVKSRCKLCEVDKEELWRDSVFTTINGRRVRVLSPEDRLISHCLHLFYHHGLKRIIWLIDIYALLNASKDKFNWEELVDKCYRYKVKMAVYYCLLSAKRKLKLWIPQEILEKLKPKGQGFITRKILDSAINRNVSEKIRFYFTLISIERLKDKLLYLFEIILPRPSVLKGIYTPKLSLQRLYLLHLKTTFVESLRAIRALI